MTDELKQKLQDIMLAYARKYELLESTKGNKNLEQSQELDNYASSVTQAFIDAGWLSPDDKQEAKRLLDEMREQVQELVNLGVVAGLDTEAGDEYVFQNQMLADPTPLAV